MRTTHKQQFSWEDEVKPVSRLRSWLIHGVGVAGFLGMSYVMALPMIRELEAYDNANQQACADSTLPFMRVDIDGDGTIDDIVYSENQAFGCFAAADEQGRVPLYLHPLPLAIAPVDGGSSIATYARLISKFNPPPLHPRAEPVYSVPQMF